MNSGGNDTNSANRQMRQNKLVQIPKFYTQLPDENPAQLYAVLEINLDAEWPRADIKVLNTDLSCLLLNTVLLFGLGVGKADTADLVGLEVKIKKANYSPGTGKVVKVSEQKIMLGLTKGVKTNVRLNITDETGKEHTGTLLVN